MENLIANLLSPHYCCSCGEIGTVLCQGCKYDIVSEQAMVCLICKSPISQNASCSNCLLPYSKMWSCGERQLSLEKLINASKYLSQRSGCKAQASLLAATMPAFDSEIVVTFVPTITSHVRQRGYDHAKLIAKEFARLRSLPFQTTLLKTNQFVQQGASRAQRFRQAEDAFKLTQNIDESKIYLLIDDVITTGATLEAATKALLAAKAKEVWVAVTAYQAL